ncbi:hypothetical protein [Stygiolobus caldivivus]|uniref:hypothetical protein n=1 Tax=Stygiolobus caldivivus TaxID=2824673 RepID=UPI001CECAE66|nr:hypothetical protein [Stygiolobus caldivivus]
MTLLNYVGPPVKLGAIEALVRILGETTVPPNYSGTLMTVKVTYEDPVTGRRGSQGHTVRVNATLNQQAFISGVDSDLMMEYRYYALMKALESQVSADNLADATRTLNEMERIAQQTKDIRLMQTTKSLKQGFQNTTDLKKEITSQVTKKMRS